jgi:hypothetical protein
MELHTNYQFPNNINNKIVRNELYPSYKSFDQLIDLEHLRSLDAYLKQKILQYIGQGVEDYFCNEHTLDEAAPKRPGVREIWLTRTMPGTTYRYLDINRTELWQPSVYAADFALLMKFVRTLPFRATGRILMIFDDSGSSVPAHRDHDVQDICHDFIWFRTNLKKPFYVLNQNTGERKYIEGYSAWFDTVNQYHGADSSHGLNFSFRVDGQFSDEFRQQIPYCDINAAATPSIWAHSHGGIR